MDGSLTMIIPVRDSRGVSQWDSAMRLLDVTVARALRQHGPTPHVVLVMTRGDRPPESASWPGVTLVEVELPYSELSEGQGKRRWIEIRRDKGARVAAGVLAAAPGGHIMVADWDDLVSPRISQLVADNPEAPGWRAESGFIFDTGRIVYAIEQAMHTANGSTLVIRSDLAGWQPGMTEFDPNWAENMFGSHHKPKEILAKQGIELAPMPFRGVAYRVGTGLNVSEQHEAVYRARKMTDGRWQLLRAMRPRIAMREFTQGLDRPIW
ncbi:hypothetical protein [Agrococcus casei]|uniref:hypothetical protein n=1 Tax=Agrococcus casei TaxID=343512 RepID=UPI003F907FAA